MTKNLIFTSILLILLLQLMGCGKKPEQNVLDHIYFETSVKEEDVWIGLITELNLEDSK